MPVQNRAAVVQALADLASQGRYSMDRQGARNMNTLFELVAALINELEDEAATPDVAEDEEESSE